MRDYELEHLERLVDELIGLDSDGRAERLRALRASNEPGIELVARLIAQHERHAGALATPPEAGQLPVGFDPWIDPLLGRRLGEFTLLALIGSGGAGRVYEARQQAPERRVAIKVLATQALAGPAAQSRFRREANVLAALEHPAICRVYAAGAAPVGANMVPYIAMEYVAGKPLDVAAAPLDQAARLALFARIADAVHFAHTQGIVHRDLKPANILVVDAGSGLVPEPKILDFGIATLSAPGGSTVTAHTEAGQVLGTPAYASPEQLAGSGGDPRSDVYALGVMLFELLTGQPPFAANATLAGAVRTASEREAPLLRTVAPGLRGDLEAIVAHALEVDPARRYPGAAALAEDLRRFATGQPVMARRPTIGYRAWRWLLRRRRTVGLASLLVVVAVIAGLALHAESESRQAVADTTYARRFEQYAGLLSEAVAAILADDPAGCRAVLDSIDPDLRGFEWRCVAAWSASAAEAKTVRRADGDPITHAQRIELAEPRTHEPFCDLGNWDGATRTFELIDVRDRSAIVTLRDLPGRPWRFAVTPTHSHLLFSGMPEHALEVYDIATGRRVARLDGFNGEDNYLRVAPDGASCALAGNSGRVRFFSRCWSPAPSGRCRVVSAASISRRMGPAWRSPGRRTGSPCSPRGMAPGCARATRGGYNPSTRRSPTMARG
ncbi:MAG: protein kinase [Planctomycetes bacterium]|nr:protein kinase [Planctomycetota bacterium]